jgi:hypothetical protein
MGGGGGDLVPHERRKKGLRGLPGRGTVARTTRSRWLLAVRSEATPRARGGGGLANRGERRGAADAVRARLTGGAGMSGGPSVSGGVREVEG